MCSGDANILKNWKVQERIRKTGTFYISNLCNIFNFTFFFPPPSFFCFKYRASSNSGYCFPWKVSQIQYLLSFFISTTSRGSLFYTSLFLPQAPGICLPAAIIRSSICIIFHWGSAWKNVPVPNFSLCCCS